MKRLSHPVNSARYENKSRWPRQACYIEGCSSTSFTCMISSFRADILSNVSCWGCVSSSMLATAALAPSKMMLCTSCTLIFDSWRSLRMRAEYADLVIVSDDQLILGGCLFGEVHTVLHVSSVHICFNNPHGFVGCSRLCLGRRSANVVGANPIRHTCKNAREFSFRLRRLILIHIKSCAYAATSKRVVPTLDCQQLGREQCLGRLFQALAWQYDRPKEGAWSRA